MKAPMQARQNPTKPAATSHTTVWSLTFSLGFSKPAQFESILAVALHSKMLGVSTPRSHCSGADEAGKNPSAHCGVQIPPLGTTVPSSQPLAPMLARPEGARQGASSQTNVEGTSTPCSQVR
eukprot:gnl/TRDRNA2_/TRDRNA2_81015_c1_seq2.p1 gnl/TRDRNA2_/TRDRNA2_81015_c1~~gnl/TRDRNA2_/TRDRNA2_81015_c1_seq2.p1  ORF type:complete len:122 (+),score=7.78 gnl/TRDRNA2_/TRDRNA2_81015_c1_seq2:76-441(+)